MLRAGLVDSLLEQFSIDDIENALVTCFIEKHNLHTKNQLINCVYQSDWNCCGTPRDIEIWNYLTWNDEQKQKDMQRTTKLKQKILQALEFYEQNGKCFVDVKPDGSVQVRELLSEKALNALKKIGEIEIYVRILQEGDPEAENPKAILDEIDRIIERKM